MPNEELKPATPACKLGALPRELTGPRALPVATKGTISNLDRPAFL